MKLGKLVEDINQKITNLNNKRLGFEGKELSDVPLEKVEPQFLQNVEINSATESTLQKILGFIKDARTQKIGIWGMGGIGKTTTLKLLNDWPEVAQTFEIVICKEIKGRRKIEIAECLKLPVSNESDDRLKATGDVAMFSSIEPIARCIVQVCNGLPLAIVIVSSSLRKISEAVVWTNTFKGVTITNYISN
ncbi:putative disease resistance protein isoform X2 [Cinnamomum micranthum f. kanehirae]|uniref:Putative disease resistance protein isoform X2 n=1 Tax=Cinnamomum micranthum f. kanehirae TaxID=337451 RepID=A0A443N0I6_9MAGN|nr:putative disease resistance protein isoform X2 [Cinnamomum micranthum f. kanehirae]